MVTSSGSPAVVAANIPDGDPPCAASSVVLPPSLAQSCPKVTSVERPPDDSLATSKSDRRVRRMAWVHSLVDF